jgi:hypothetical protein
METSQHFDKSIVRPHGKIKQPPDVLPTDGVVHPLLHQFSTNNVGACAVSLLFDLGAARQGGSVMF